jgi:hypothetical protein
MSKETSSEYKVERLTKERLHDVESIYEAVYQKKAAPNYFMIKYDTAYTGVDYVGYVAYNNANEPVAYYGVIPCFLDTDNGKFLAAQSADTMTHPGFRFKGMFVELSNLTFALCKQLGIRLIFGFPNQNSYHGAVTKLGWKLTEMMTCFMIPVKTLPLAKVCSKWSVSSNLYNLYAAAIKRKFKTSLSVVVNSSVEERYIGVRRDQEYARSKQYSPREVLQIGKALVWCKYSEELIIGDIDLAGEDFTYVLRKVTALARVLGLTRIQFHTSPGTKLYSLFASSFSAQESFPALIQDFDSGVQLEKIKFTLADIDIF